MKKNLKGIFAIWYREFKVFTREKSRVVSSIFMPLIWYFIFGSGMKDTVKVGIDYRYFIFPGFLVMVVIFSSIFNGVYIVWDRKIDFLKEVLIAPLSRTTVFFGKVLGCLTDAILQASILLIIGIVLKIPFTIKSIFLSIITLVLLGISLASLGLIIGSFMESLEGFGLVSSFIVYPMFLLSGALYPLENLPPLLRVLTRVDPASYAVDIIRYSLTNISTLPIELNLLFLLLSDIGFVLIGTWAFNRMNL